jgi:hypothetical protein
MPIRRDCSAPERAVICSLERTRRVTAIGHNQQRGSNAVAGGGRRWLPTEPDRDHQYVPSV